MVELKAPGAESLGGETNELIGFDGACYGNCTYQAACPEVMPSVPKPPSRSVAGLDAVDRPVFGGRDDQSGRPFGSSADEQARVRHRVGGANSLGSCGASKVSRSIRSGREEPLWGRTNHRG